MVLINKNQSFAVFGSTGMVGSAICRNLQKNNYLNILKPTSKDLDLLNYSAVKDWFVKYKPEIIILSAAKVGGIYANDKYPADFILKNLKIQNNVIEISWLSGVKKAFSWK